MVLKPHVIPIPTMAPAWHIPKVSGVFISVICQFALMKLQYVLSVWTLYLFCVGTKAVVVNVTFTGLAPSWKNPLPATWNVTIVSQVTTWTYGNCPAGFYCPQYATDPIPCPLGTYYPYPKTTSVCTALCPLNYYCVDAKTYAKCPDNTGSQQGSSSKLDCKCKQGFTCTYTKQVNINVVLQVPPSFWLSDASIRQQFVQAVAQAAGVPVENVILENVLPHLGKRMLLGVESGDLGALSGDLRSSSVAEVDIRQTQGGAGTDVSTIPQHRSLLRGEIMKRGKIQEKHAANRENALRARPRATLVRARVIGATQIDGLDVLLARHPLLKSAKHRSWPVSSIHVEKQSVAVEA